MSRCSSRAASASDKANLDVLGTLLGSGGLFFVVYGFAHAVNTGWGNWITWGSLVIGVVFLVTFVQWQQRSKNPLLPLRLLINRVRGGSLVALFLTSIGIFGISLFLAYYLQGTLGYSPLRTGVAFLPLVGAIALSASIASARLLAVSGPRPLIPTGMLLCMMGMVLFTRLTPSADYFSNVLPGLVVTGLGLGLIFAPAIASATAGVRLSDVGAASALVNTTQQIGGSMGLALLNTIAVSVTARANPHPTIATRTSAALGRGPRDAARLRRGVLVGGGILRRRCRSSRSDYSSPAFPRTTLTSRPRPRSAATDTAASPSPRRVPGTWRSRPVRARGVCASANSIGLSHSPT